MSYSRMWPDNYFVPPLQRHVYDKLIAQTNVAATQVNEPNKGGGLGALETLAEAVEQERRRQELSSQLEEEARYLDAIGAEVS